MSFKFSPTICEFCGLNRKHHDEVQKQKCSQARKVAHEKDKRPRKKDKNVVYDESTINYFSGTK